MVYSVPACATRCYIGLHSGGCLKRIVQQHRKPRIDAGSSRTPPGSSA